MRDLFERLGGVLRGEQERTLGRHAVRAGFLGEEELEAILRRGERVEEVLRARGLDVNQIARLRGEIDREEYDLFRPGKRTPPEVAAVQDGHDRRLAEFVLVSRLGQGGIGDVWKAWDTRLGRWVAIKLPRSTPDQEATARRFTREALAAARLSHPNIVGIYRVAEEGRRPFIVMQYVEGKTLGATRPRLRHALEILRDVAAAVHHAHEQGVVHRDLKPGNILIAPDGRPFVLDFGLAHLEEAAWLHSREGQVAGTAAYMSPEQAMGGPAGRGRSTDVYSLGATLYEAVAGRPPFGGESFAEIVNKVVREDPRKPRDVNPAVPRDVEAVILKAMEKEPRGRYGTARELAEDLDRCLKGEPIAARANWVTSIRRGVRRHARLAMALAAAGVLAFVIGGWEMWRGARAERRELEAKLRTVREFGHFSIGAILAVRRAGANEGMAALLSDFEKALRDAPEVAEVDYLRGRVERALMNDARALEHQERALARDANFVAALYEKLVLLSHGGAREEVLRCGARLEGHVGRLGPAHALTARGVLAFHRGEAGAAGELLGKALAADPNLEEASETLARASLFGVTAYSPPAEQQAAYAKADEALGRALGHDKGYGPFWAARGRVRMARGILQAETGRDPQADFQGAEDDFGHAIRILPRAETYRGRAALRTFVAVRRMELGGNPLQDFKEAEADLEEALGSGRGDVLTIVQRGLIRQHRARYRVERGEDPEEDCRAAHEELRPWTANPAALVHRAALRGYRGLYRFGRGEDPEEDFKEACRLFGEALKLDPDSPEGLERRAAFRLERARWQKAKGKDPGEALVAAEKEIARALEKAPFFRRARVTRAAVLRFKGLQEEAAGRDPSELFSRAQKDLAETLQVNPLATDAWIEQGHLEHDWGRYRMSRTDKPGARENFTQSIRCYEEALRLNPFLPGKLREPVRESRRALLGTY